LRMTCIWVCFSRRLGFSPYRPSAGRRDGWTYATRQGSGPSTLKKVSGHMVPAPTSTSYGSAITQSFCAQNSLKRKIMSWKERAPAGFLLVLVVGTLNVLG